MAALERDAMGALALGVTVVVGLVRRPPQDRSGLR